MNTELKQYTDWMKSQQWEIFLTLRLPPNLQPRAAPTQAITDVIRPLAKHLKCRLGAVIVTSYGHAQHRAHLHVALISSDGQLLANFQKATDYLDNLKSPLTNHQNAIDFRVYLSSRHAAYTAQHMLEPSDIQVYDRNLLTEKGFLCTTTKSSTM